MVECLSHPLLFQLKNTVVSAQAKKKDKTSAVKELKWKLNEATNKLSPEMRLKGNRQLNKEKKLELKKMKKQRKKAGKCGHLTYCTLEVR